MSFEPEIIPVDSSDRIRNTSTPYMQLRLNGNSYVNKRAARMLGIDHGSMLRFYQTGDPKIWFISNDEHLGAGLRKVSGLYKFCDVVIVRKVFKAFGIEGTRADFPLAAEVEKRLGPDGEEITVLFIKPHPYNIK